MIEIKTNDPHFLALVLLTDETWFIIERIFNTQCEHVWAESNHNSRPSVRET